MKFLIDTNICIYIMNNYSPKIVKKFKKIGAENIWISSITSSELYYGAYKSNQINKNLKRLEEFLIPFEIIQYDEKASKYYGEVRSQLEKQGQTIGPLDLLIVAHALSKNLTLITNNEKGFKRVKKLKVENWGE